MRRAVRATAYLLVTLGLAACGHGGSTTTRSSAPTPTPSHTAALEQPELGPAPTQVTATTVGWQLAVPSARQALIALGGSKVMLAGGMLAGDTSTADVRRIDLATGKSQSAAPLAVPVHDAAGGPYAGHPAVFGGGNASEQSLVQSLTGPRWSRVDAFPTTRSDLSVVTTPAGTLALGGYDGSAVPRPVVPPARAPAGCSRSAGSRRGSGTPRPPSWARRSTSSAVRWTTPSSPRCSASTPHGPDEGRRAAPARARSRDGGDRRRPGAADGRPPRRGLAHARDVVVRPGDVAVHPGGPAARALSDAAVAVDGSTVWLLGGEDPRVTDRVVRLVVR